MTPANWFLVVLAKPFFSKLTHSIWLEKWAVCLGFKTKYIHLYIHHTIACSCADLILNRNMRVIFLFLLGILFDSFFCFVVGSSFFYLCILIRFFCASRLLFGFFMLFILHITSFRNACVYMITHYYDDSAYRFMLCSKTIANGIRKKC